MSNIILVRVNYIVCVITDNLIILRTTFSSNFLLVILSSDTLPFVEPGGRHKYRGEDEEQRPHRVSLFAPGQERR